MNNSLRTAPFLGTKCPVCDNRDIRERFEKQEDHFVCCSECGLLFIHPQPSAERIKGIYDKEYYAPWQMETDRSLVEAMKIVNFQFKLDIVERYLTPGRALDIGCAFGAFLEAAGARGWDAYGVELSPYSAQQAREKFGEDKVFNCSIEDAGFNSCSFDAVFMSDLLEHIKDVNETIRKAHDILDNNGLLAILTPNIDSLSAKVMGSKWPQIKAEHLFYFSEQSIRRLLNKHAFHIILIRPCPKTMCLRYLGGHLSLYSNSLFVKFFASAIKQFPARLRNTLFNIHLGEMFILARKQQL